MSVVDAALVLDAVTEDDLGVINAARAAARDQQVVSEATDPNTTG